MIPPVAGVSDLQRNGKKTLQPVKNQKDNIVLLADRNHVFGVIMNIEYYKELLNLVSQQETDFWANAFASSLDFWNHKSNDAYEKLL